MKESKSVALESIITRLARARAYTTNYWNYMYYLHVLTIENTGIAKHFSTVFRELVPQGKGTLVIQTKSLEDNDSDSEEEDEEGSEGELGEEKYEEKENRSSNRGKKRRKSGVSKKKGNKNKKRKKSSSSSSSASRQSSVSHYSGVSIRVSFTGSDQPQTMVALSGGKQSSHSGGSRIVNVAIHIIYALPPYTLTLPFILFKSYFSL